MSYIDIGKLTEEVNNITANTNNKPYKFFKWPATSASLPTGSSTKYEFDMTPVLGRPIYLNINGDVQSSGTAGGWIWVRLYVDSPSGTKLAEIVTVSESDSTNVPFSLTYLDANVQKGVKKHYYFEILNNSGKNVNIGENGAAELPQLIAFEI